MKKVLVTVGRWFYALGMAVYYYITMVVLTTYVKILVGTGQYTYRNFMRIERATARLSDLRDDIVCLQYRVHEWGL